MKTSRGWLRLLKTDPLPGLLDGRDQALAYFVRQDLLDEPVASADTLWAVPDAIRVVEKQKSDGAWPSSGKSEASATSQNYRLTETYRHLRLLVEMYGFTRAHPALRKAAEYTFACQTEAGDIRGILGHQYMPYYHGALLELLIKAGYGDDARVVAGLDWLLAMRQNDGGWIVPAQAVPSRQRTSAFWSGPPLLPNRALPHAHLATGMALRALAAHPRYRRRAGARAAGQCLCDRLFRPDAYNDRKAPAYWLKFQFPFWWTNLLTALDSLGRLGFSRQEPNIERGLAWFAANQAPDGLWPTGYDKGQKAEANRRWVGLAVCRVLKHFHSGESQE